MNEDFKIMNLFSRISDFLVLNFLFIITSLPVITLGASITALYSVNLKMVTKSKDLILRATISKPFEKILKLQLQHFFSFSLPES